MTVRTAIVPVAGLGTRLLPITAATPKELLPLGGKPVLHYIAEELGRVGVQKIILVSSHQKQQIARYFQLNQALVDSLRESGKEDLLNSLWSQSPHMGIDFEVEIQHQQRGLGDAVLCGIPKKPQPVIVALGDCVIGLGGKSTLLQRMLDVYESQSADMVIAFEEVPQDRVHRYGIAQPTATEQGQDVFRLEGIVEKPERSEAPSNLAVAARYIFGFPIFNELKNLPPGKNNEIQLTDAIQNLLKFGAKAYGVRLSKGESRYDVGNINSYVESFVQFALADPELRESVLRSVPNKSP